MRPACIIASGAALAALLLAGCSTSSGLFGKGSLFDESASTVADHGSDLYAAAGKIFSGPSYCRKADPTQVYKVGDGDCAAGDTAIKSYEYDAQVAQNQDRAWQQLHAAALAEAAQPTYCRTATSHTAYRSPSGKCQAGEQTIGEAEYDAAKAQAAAAWAKVP
jgi:hypothetical protein